MILFNLRVIRNDKYLLVVDPYHILYVWIYFLPSFPSQLVSPSFTAPPVPATFSFDLVQVTEQQVHLRWSHLEPLKSLNLSFFEIFLQYQEEGNIELIQDKEDRSMKSEDKQGTQSLNGIRKLVRVPISLSSRAVTVTGLSPGSIYSFTLRAAHPTGSTWSLGQTRTAYTSESADTHEVHKQVLVVKFVTSRLYVIFLTGPLPPQNITFGPSTINQISVRWMLTDAQSGVGQTFVVRYEDVSSRKESIVGMTNISRLSETGGLQVYTAVIGGLRPHRKYRVGVYTVTQRGIESCGQAPVTVQTGERVTGRYGRYV